MARAWSGCAVVVRAARTRTAERPGTGAVGHPGATATAPHQDHLHSKVSKPSSANHPHSADVGHNSPCMPYRPQKRRAVRPRNGNGNGSHHRASYAARLAIARSTVVSNIEYPGCGGGGRLDEYDQGDSREVWKTTSHYSKVLFMHW